MPNICMVYTWDHTRHAIIRREIDALTSAGYAVSVRDYIAGRCTHYTASSRSETRPALPLRAWRKCLHSLASRVREHCHDGAGWGRADAALSFLHAVRTVPLLLAGATDCLEAHDLQALRSALLAGRARRLPVVYHAHEMEADMFAARSPRNLALSALEGRLLPRVDRLIVPSRLRADVYQAEHRLRSVPVVVRNCPPFVSQGRTGYLRSELSLPRDCRIVLYQGNLEDGRGLEALISAAGLFDRQVVLVLMGYPTHYSESVLEPLRRRQRLERRVFFAPPVPLDKVLGYAASADLGVVIYEKVHRNNLLCAPSKMYEYVMSGIPFVGSDLPEIRGFLEQYPVGLTFDTESAPCIADAVNRMLDVLPAQAERLSGQLAAARERFNWQSEAAGLLGAFACLGSDMGAQRPRPGEAP